MLLDDVWRRRYRLAHPRFNLFRDNDMQAGGARILCVGTESSLLELRCAVLAHGGYNARTATPEDAISLLLSEKFDLVIVSSRLSEHERRRVMAAAGDTPALALIGLILPRDLLREVEGRVSKVARCS